MAEPGRYLIGESLREKLKSTIAKVDSFAPGSPLTRIKTVIEGDGQGYVPKTFKICTFTGAWAKGTDKVVTFKYQTTSPNTVTVTNLFFPVTSTAASATNCAIAKDGTAWFLVAVPLATATAFFIKSTTAGTIIVRMKPGVGLKTIGQVDIVTNVAVSATLNPEDCSISVTPTLTKESAIVIKETETMQVIQETSDRGIFIQETFTATFVKIES
jgi:hypothetical protein